jgi:DNA-binding YbaB/EbfC family protein
MVGVGKLMKQMAKMQKKMNALQESLAEQEMDVSSGGGAVTVTVSLQAKVKRIKLDPEFLKEDVGLVEETILEAVQNALTEANARSEAAMEEVTGEFKASGLPGL